MSIPLMLWFCWFWLLIQLSLSDQRNAASTYNILNEEGRIVAAALLPYGVTS